eukprot:CAMPEP_0197247776 /NCGR_PEP_ID=MMETSP1429-20130617/32196_1 /TAXON_ID=49237 /ORGANISM="Chaetoceros  sp., Strain UNC1202" /LENGTH=115 /DNA_ID=CAMNT_0042708779 /DNA_START=73 /DNA_END=420 /DNA_ORIENTATION=+
MNRINQFTTLLVLAFLSSGANAFAPNCSQKNSMALKMGLLDNVKFLFSDEGKKKRQELERLEREEEEEAQRLMRERRLNPDKMTEYEENVVTRRAEMKARKDKLQEFQNDVRTED